MADYLAFRGIVLNVVELPDHVFTPLDAEYGPGVAGFEQSDHDTLTVSTQSGQRYPADRVILALGVRPDTTLARLAGIEIGEHGGIRVDEQMRTSTCDIFAFGDAVEEGPLPPTSRA